MAGAYAYGLGDLFGGDRALHEHGPDLRKLSLDPGRCPLPVKFAPLGCKGILEWHGLLDIKHIP